jgi:hypothetical protein
VCLSQIHSLGDFWISKSLGETLTGISNISEGAGDTSLIQGRTLESAFALKKEEDALILY